jgi:tRNA threonylcarbamoyladenosine biosynthesis protein TsaB
MPQSDEQLPRRLGDIHLSKPEGIDLTGIQFLAGSALKVYGARLFTNTGEQLSDADLDPDIQLSALGLLDCAKQMFKEGKQCPVRELEPLYVRDKVAFTTQERQEGLKS